MSDLVGNPEDMFSHVAAQIMPHAKPVFCICQINIIVKTAAAPHP